MKTKLKLRKGFRWVELDEMRIVGLDLLFDTNTRRWKKYGPGMSTHQRPGCYPAIRKLVTK